MNNREDQQILERLYSFSEILPEDLMKADRIFLSKLIAGNSINNGAFELIDHFVSHPIADEAPEKISEYFISLFNFHPALARSKNADGKTFLEYIITCQLHEIDKLEILLEAIKAGALLSEDLPSKTSRAAFKMLFANPIDGASPNNGTQDEKLSRAIFTILASDMHIDMNRTKHLNKSFSNFGMLKNALHTQEFYKKRKLLSNYNEVRELSALVDGLSTSKEKDFDFNQFISTTKSTGISRNLLYWATFDTVNTTFCTKENLKIAINTILDTGESIDTQAEDRWTILSSALNENRALSAESNVCTKRTLINLLIELGANLDALSGERGDTPLHIAIRMNDLESVRALMAAGADPQIPNESEEETAIERAEEHENEEMARIVATQEENADLEQELSYAGMMNVMGATSNEPQQPQAFFNPIRPTRTRDTRAPHTHTFNPYAPQHTFDSNANSTINAQTRMLPPLQAPQPAFSWNRGIPGNTNQFSGAINAQTRMLPPLQAQQAPQQFVTPPFHQQQPNVGDTSAYNYAHTQAQSFVPQQQSFSYNPYAAVAPQQYFGQSTTTINNTFNFNSGVNNIGNDVYNNAFASQPQQRNFNNGNYASNYRGDTQRGNSNYSNNKDDGPNSGFNFGV